MDWSDAQFRSQRFWASSFYHGGLLMASPTKYQEVVTATNYALTAEDGTPFSVFLRFDGTDDSMATGNIDFTGTDKMSVFAGVRKLSDGGSASIVDLYSGGVSSFTVRAPSSAAPNYNATITSTAGIFESGDATTFAAPITSTLSAIFDRAALTDATRSALRVNGSAKTLTFGSNGAPASQNFSNAPLYVGSRTGTSFRFNGRLYSLVVCGKLASAAEIASTEAWVNQKTRAFA